MFGVSGLVSVIAAVTALFYLKVWTETFRSMVKTVDMKSSFNHFVRVVVVVQVYND